MEITKKERKKKKEKKNNQIAYIHLYKKTMGHIYNTIIIILKGWRIILPHKNKTKIIVKKINF
jgi:hypothetical protein